MKKILTLIIALSFTPLFWAQKSYATKNVWMSDNGDGTFTNPILWSNWADLDVIRVKDDF